MLRGAGVPGGAGGVGDGGGEGVGLGGGSVAVGKGVGEGGTAVGMGVAAGVVSRQATRTSAGRRSAQSQMVELPEAVRGAMEREGLRGFPAAIASNLESLKRRDAEARAAVAYHKAHEGLEGHEGQEKSPIAPHVLGQRVVPRIAVNRRRRLRTPLPASALQAGATKPAAG